MAPYTLYIRTSITVKNKYYLYIKDNKTSKYRLIDSNINDLDYLLGEYSCCSANIPGKHLIVHTIDFTNQADLRKKLSASYPEILL